MAIAVAALLAAAAPAIAAKRPRPPDLPRWQVVTETAPNELAIFNDYATAERSISARRAVVHYVVVGIDAPPLNDDDADTIPDYVERVGEAADTAIGYYERRGFRPIAADTGGPDGRPDLYISRFAPGYLGIALPGCRAAGGAFVAVANNLDPSAGRSFASLYATVAHELFHLVQFSYFAAEAEPPLADWVLEGAATAIESRLYPQLDDLASTILLRSWFAAPSRPVVARSYSAQLLWRYLDARSPRLINAYLDRLSGRPTATQAATLAATYQQLSGDAFASAFGGFALAAYADHSTEITPTATIAPTGHRTGSIAPLAIHYLRLTVPRSSDYTLRLTLPKKDSAIRVELAYQLLSQIAGHASLPRQIHPRISLAGRLFTFRIPLSLRTERFADPTLVIANGAPERAAAYTLTTGRNENARRPHARHDTSA